MLRLLLTTLAVSYASGALHGICHSNNLQMTEAQVVNQLADICDRDNNGVIRESEVVVGFSDILGTTLPLPEVTILAMDYQSLLGLAAMFGFSIDRQDFIQKWHAQFHDNHEFIGATFDAFDDNMNGVWTIQEVDGILNHIKASSDNGDGIISRQEFVSYFMAIYQNC